ncbi:MAG: acylphosphatase [Flavobacteriales bacterium]|nr:acylphosphatase [Flavobacteriales bacterium]
MRKSFNIIVAGKVQGVWFRPSTLRKASDLTIVGWVRNCENGNVEIHAEGEEMDLELFVEWCKVGPELARVDDITVSEAKEVRCDDFLIANKSIG